MYPLTVTRIKHNKHRLKTEQHQSVAGQPYRVNHTRLTFLPGSRTKQSSHRRYSILQFLRLNWSQSSLFCRNSLGKPLQPWNSSAHCLWASLWPFLPGQARGVVSLKQREVRILVKQSCAFRVCRNIFVGWKWFSEVYFCHIKKARRQNWSMNWITENEMKLELARRFTKWPPPLRMFSE